MQVYLVATKATLFPDSVRWKKTYLPLELLFAALLVCNAVLELLDGATCVAPEERQPGLHLVTALLERVRAQ